jgi:hypothetical protein
MGRECDYRFRAPSGHLDRCLVCISLILLCRAWSKLGVQVVVCNWVGDPLIPTSGCPFKRRHFGPSEFLPPMVSKGRLSRLLLCGLSHLFRLNPQWPARYTFLNEMGDDGSRATRWEMLTSDPKREAIVVSSADQFFPQS